MTYLVVFSLFFFFFCSSFSSRLHYKIEQKNHSPSNFAWVSKDQVGWHGVGEETKTTRACPKKEREKGSLRTSLLQWAKNVRRRLSQHSDSSLTLSKHNTRLALKETSCTLVFHARQVYVTTNMAHHKHISSQWARYKEKENRASCLMYNDRSSRKESQLPVSLPSGPWFLAALAHNR